MRKAPPARIPLAAVQQDSRKGTTVIMQGMRITHGADPDRKSGNDLVSYGPGLHARPAPELHRRHMQGCREQSCSSSKTAQLYLVAAGPDMEHHKQPQKTQAPAPREQQGNALSTAHDQAIHSRPRGRRAALRNLPVKGTPAGEHSTPSSTEKHPGKINL
jgi:hypothetical protein